MSKCLISVAFVGLFLAGAVQAQPSTAQILNQRLPDVQFVEQPFDQVMDWLTELTELDIVVRWQVLEDAGITRDAPVSLKVRNVRLTQVLWLIMNDVGRSEIKLAYRASGRLLILSTEEDLGQEMVVKVYDVADLLLNVPKASRMAAFDVTQGLGQQGGGGGGGGSGMFGQNQNQGQRQGQDNSGRGGGAAADAQMDELIDLIMATIEPNSWVGGGGQGTIHSFGKLLVVRNTLKAHQALGGPVRESEISGP